MNSHCLFYLRGVVAMCAHLYQLCLSPLGLVILRKPSCSVFYLSCVLVYFYSKTNEMYQSLKLICFGMTLYMFRAVFPSIIRSSRLYIQQQAFVKQTLPTACYQADSSICLTYACWYMYCV